MQRALMLFVVILTVAFNMPSSAWGQQKPKVVATLPSLTAIAQEVGGDRFEYISLARPDQDPHFVSPTPALMRKTREAALLIEMGMLFETWLEEVANGSGNPLIVRGGKGRITVSTNVPKLEVPTQLTRSDGDLHPMGNAHMWVDPLRVKIIAEAIARGLTSVAPAYEGEFKENLKKFQDRIDESFFGKELVRLVGSAKLTRLALDGRLKSFLDEQEIGGQKLNSKAGGWFKKAEPLRANKVVEYHRVWVYFCKTFGIEKIGDIEEKPGVPPGPRYLREITNKIKQDGIRLLLIDNFYDPSVPNKISKETAAKVVILPNQVGGEEGVDNYFQFIDRVLDKMLKTLA